MTVTDPEDAGEHLLYAIFGELPGPDACECGMPTECAPSPTADTDRLTPFTNIGQPCGGMECDGQTDLCADCEQSYQDHYDSLKPWA